jgi:hypothetical protein
MALEVIMILEIDSTINSGAKYQGNQTGLSLPWGIL